MDRISALVDGELDADQMAQELSRIKQQDSLREGWDTFHLIGDAMRGDCRLSPDFGKRIAERLAAEPTVLAPRRGIIRPRRAMAYALSAAASLSAVALVAWMAFSTNPLNAPQEIAKVQTHAAPPASVPSQGMNEYLLAHQAFSPSTAIQGVLPYIRSVSDNQPSQNR